MEIKKNILAIFRVLEAIPERSGDRYQNAIETVKKVLTPEDKKDITKILQAMMLLTAGNQETLRDPEKYEPGEAKDNFSTLFSTKSYTLYTDLGIPFNSLKPPTKEDYELAKKLLPIMGSSFVTSDDIDAVIGTTGEMDRRFMSEGHDIVYRGLHKLDKNTIAFLMDNPTWDIGRGVSTSYDRLESRRFSKSFATSWGSTQGPAILFTINNASKRGFHAGSLSRFYREKEVILAGQLKIRSWTIEAVGRVMPEYGDEKECKIQITSKDKEAVLSWGAYYKNEYIALKFPTELGESFEEFSQNLILGMGGLISQNGEEIEFEVYPDSVLLLADATLP